MYLPEEGTNLKLLSDFAAYDPQIPASILTPLEFGKTQVLLVDGYVGDDVSTRDLPTVKIANQVGQEVLRVSIDPSFSILQVESDLNNVMPFPRRKKRFCW